ncbi:MAG: L-seryl-tRNA(Sec) selenium transferase [Phycisphaerae bacterium]|nr:L-seryl-tRNA(Sec) selenium transferase [Phycisphaerae bacterium]NNF43707.1 L-seryl-tRNA(Sec) selenium transferase [Phycisphaerales bacterium]
MSARHIPSVHELVERVQDDPTLDATARPLIVAAARAELQAHRGALQQRREGPITIEALTQRTRERLAREARPPLMPAINATGIIVHTGLGRAPLATAAAEAMAAVSSEYAPVELDVAAGARGRRTMLVRDLLCELTGAESATVVNNNAAALVLTLAALAADREVIVSRGELIEIGGSFRLPDVMVTSGATLREVGTTNRTRLSDYDAAITDCTAVLLKVHPSNYRVEGFRHEVEIEELVSVGRAKGVMVVHDVGSGALRPLRELGLEADEPDVARSIAAGADLVLFSGDKLLGGPQAGIAVGRTDAVDRLERHPLMRALRVDKHTLAGLGVTLQIHRDPARAARELPVIAAALVPLTTLEERGRRIVATLEACDGLVAASVEPAVAHLGGGALPAQAIPSRAVVLEATGGEEALARRLRSGDPAVIARAHDGKVWIDLRTVPARHDATMVAALRVALR